MGGTWDLFRYPGVRSDSDMFTLSYPFRPWTRRKSMADARHIPATSRTPPTRAASTGTSASHRVVGADWSASDARWTLRLESPTGRDADVRLPLRLRRLLRLRRGTRRSSRASRTSRARWCTRSPGPRTSYDDQRVVVIGSGATAVTLVPAMAGGRRT